MPARPPHGDFSIIFPELQNKITEMEMQYYECHVQAYVGVVT